MIKTKDSQIECLEEIARQDKESIDYLNQFSKDSIAREGKIILASLPDESFGTA